MKKPSSRSLPTHIDRGGPGRCYRLRVTVDAGKKVVGRRIMLPLATQDLNEAILRRNLTIRLLEKLGLKVRMNRIIRAPKGTKLEHEIPPNPVYINGNSED